MNTDQAARREIGSWPQVLWIVRHGQSAGNVARDAAESGELAYIDIEERDVDVPLSSLGEQQATALGEWFGAMAGDDRPEVVFSSPYVRARQSATKVLQALQANGRDAPKVRLDERLREKEFGILDQLTRRGIRERHPELADKMTRVGKFYFRPPGGESWCDVILRLRSFIEMVSREHAGDRVLIVAHQVTVNCLRYLLERLTEEEILAIDRRGDVPNCGVTSYEFDAAKGLHGELALHLQNFVSPLAAAGAPVTAQPDLPIAPKS